MGAKVKKSLDSQSIFGNPLGLAAIFTLLSVAARVLKALGVLDELEAKAEATENDADDKLIRVVKGILNELAK